MTVTHETTSLPFFLEEMTVDGDTKDGEYAWAHICKECADKHGLETSDTCLSGNVCLCKDCQNETSLVHYVWDYRGGPDTGK
jgi:hypothetical protein